MSVSLSLQPDLLYHQQTIKDRAFHPTRTFIEFKKPETEQSIIDRFEQQVDQNPNHTATKTRYGELTYRALNQIANQIARAILAKGGTGVEPVALLLGNDIPMIAAIFGTLKAGKIYLPVDPLHPISRITHILKDAQPSLILTNTKYLALAQQLVSDPSQLIDLDQDLDDLSPQNLGLSIPPDRLAYIIYTSGSTGQPKGITQTHRNVLHNIMNYTNAWHICGYDRLSLFHSCSFASGQVDIFCALLNGATVYPWDLKADGFNHLTDWLTSEEVTILNWIPTPFRHLVSTIKEGQRFPKLRLIALGSEPVLGRDVILFKQHFSPDCILVNRLGSTEAMNVCFYFIDQQTEFSSQTVPAGYPVDDKEVLLIDEAGAPIGPGSLGEIAVRSPYLSPGYWNRPELTEKVFLADPEEEDKRIYLTGDLGLIRPDGCLEYFGRKDFQIKIRGHRIDLSEIESTLLKMKNLKEAAVMAAKDEAGELRLAVYVVPEQGSLVSAHQLYFFLKEQLPDYMMPAAFVLLDSLPVNANGKLDRRALSAYDHQLQPLAAPGDFVAPTTPTEERLAAIWAALLKLDRVGVQDNFFALGGHSLLGTQLMSRLKDAFGIDLSLDALFEAPTITELGQLVEQMKNGQSKVDLPAITPVARQPYRLKRS